MFTIEFKIPSTLIRAAQSTKKSQLRKKKFHSKKVEEKRTIYLIYPLFAFRSNIKPSYPKIVKKLFYLFFYFAYEVI
jgi:hypothetical protein